VIARGNSTGIINEVEPSWLNLTEVSQLTPCSAPDTELQTQSCQSCHDYGNLIQCTAILPSGKRCEVKLCGSKALADTGCVLVSSIPGGTEKFKCPPCLVRAKGAISVRKQVYFCGAAGITDSAALAHSTQPSVTIFPWASVGVKPPRHC
jgi:hypothetical protein